MYVGATMNTRSGSGSSFERGLIDDGLYVQPIKEHSLEKFARHNRYARMFSTGMKNRWPQRAYLGLYSGAGRACVEETGEIVETTAMSVLRLPDPFTKYVFVDNDPRCSVALRARVAASGTGRDVSIIEGDVNDTIRQVKSALPPFDKVRGLLSFCFVDPFAANLKFETIAALGTYRMDFLILLALGVDARRNFQQYYEDQSDTRIADLIACPAWRTEWKSWQAKDRNLVRFLLTKFDQAMTKIGYRPAQPTHQHPVKVGGRGPMQYILVFYSKNALGQTFWETTLETLDPQLGLGFTS